MRYLLGIDAGTTSFKCILFDENGRVKAKASEDYKLLTPLPERVEFDPEKYWIICKTVIKKVLQQVDIDIRNIKALAIDSQGETLICVDQNGKPIRNAIVWLDNRSVEEADAIRMKFSTPEVYKVTGQPEVAATWPATKILWLKRNEPFVFNNTYKYLLLEDYLIYKLTGIFVTEKSLISSSMYFNIHSGSWWHDMLDFIGISSVKLPKIKESGELVGVITPEASVQTGLGVDTVVVTGALDQAAGMIGAGNIAPGIITETTGTCLAICVNVDPAVVVPVEAKIPVQCHALKDKYYLISWSPTAGMMLKWFKNNFYRGQYEDDNSVFEIMDIEAGKVMPGSEGLITLPYLSGAAFPEFNPFAKGVFFGFTLGHGREHFIRSILEAVAYMLNQNIKTIEQSGVRVDEVRSMGGGARSCLWNSIKADVTGKTIITLQNDETACLGAAILAGVGAGIFPSIENACSHMVEVREKFKPDLSQKVVYEKGFNTYLNLYKNLENMFKKDS